MQSGTSDQVDLLTRGSDMFVSPLSYTMALRMFVARCWPCDATPREGIYVVFENCTRMKVVWKGKAGPYRLSLRRTENKLLEVRDSTGEFTIVCGDVTQIEDPDVSSFFRNLKSATL